MRRKLIEADLIECVVGLGPNLFYNSAMDSCVVVCRADKPKNRRGKILLIDAKDEVTRDRTQSFLTPEHLSRIIRTYRTFKEEPHFSRVVSLPEARANEGNLNIALYIDSTPKAAVGVATLEHDLATAYSGYTQSSASVRRALATLLDGDGRGAQKLEGAFHGIVLPKWLDKSKWKRVRLGDVAVRDAGKIEPDGTMVHRWVAADHIDEGDIHVRRWSDTNDPLFPPTFRYTFRAGNVLLHSRNPKKVVIPRFDGITGEKLFVLKARNAEVLREDILAFVLMSSHFSNWVSQWMSGSVNKFLNWSAFEKFEFDLPPLDQQRRIAEILWAVDEAISAAENMASALEGVVRGRIAEAMGNGAEDNANRTHETPLGRLPVGWEAPTLREVCSVITDGVHKKPNYVERGIPFITVKNLTREPGISFEDVNYISEADHAEFTKRTRPERGDVLLSKDGATLGVPRVVETDRQFSIFVSVALLKPDHAQLDPYYLCYGLESPVLGGRLIKNQTGSEAVRKPN